MKGSYHFTLEGLRSAEDHDITSAEVWQVLNAERRVIRQLGETSRVIVAATAGGRYVAVMVAEDPSDDGGSSAVVAARELPPHDVPAYERLLRRRP